MSKTSQIESLLPDRALQVVKQPVTHVAMGLGVLLLDLLTGQFLLFPILFVLPVTLSAWFSSPRWAYALAVFLPFGRLLISMFIDTPSPLAYSVANAIIRVGVLVFLAFLVARNARQTKALQEQVAGLVTICAWSRTIEYHGEWISFEEYLKRHFNLDTSHGLSPAAAEKAFGNLKPK
jgi:hypothetical protein